MYLCRVNTYCIYPLICAYIFSRLDFLLHFGITNAAKRSGQRKKCSTFLNSLTRTQSRICVSFGFTKFRK